FASLAAAAAETLAHIAEERGIEIDAPIVRTIERPHCRLGIAAATLDRARIKTQTGNAVLLSAVLENFGPGIFGVAENRGDEVAHLISRLAGLLWRRLGGLFGMPSAVHQLGAADEDAWIDAQRPTYQAEHDNGSNPEATATDRDTHATAAKAAAFVAAT